MEITRQADYYGLPDNAPRNVPPAERLADILAKPTPWSGPTKVGATNEELKKGLGDALNRGNPKITQSPITPDDLDAIEHHHEDLDNPDLDFDRYGAADPAATAQINQGIQNTMPEPPEPWEAPDYTNGKPL